MDENGVGNPTLDLLAQKRAELQSDLLELDKIERDLRGPTFASPWMDYSTVLAARKSVVRRFSTGLPTLDARIEGGLYAGTLTVVQGKPGIGKTMLATQIALELGKTCAVGALFADEGIPGAAVRIGQQLGVPRADLMSGAGVDQAAELLCTTRPYFRFLDPSRAESTVEYLFEDFDRHAPAGMPRAFLIDSAQVARSSKMTARQDRRQAISTLLVQIRDLALRFQAIALVISQVNRGAYRSKKEEDRVDPLAAGLETSGIEFMAELILHLDGKPTPANPAVTLRAPKNRLSAEGTFEVPLQMDFPRARFLEADEAAMEHDAAVEREIALRPVVAELVKILADEFEDGASTRQILSETERRKGDVIAALRQGVANGTFLRMKRDGKGGGVLYRVKK